tara:strand:- start:73 stop:261 length:189 start_codon:yes stop_codon:yes gene_type:complete
MFEVFFSDAINYESLKSSAFLSNNRVESFLWRINALACVCDGEFVFNDSLHYCSIEVYGNLS